MEGKSVDMSQFSKASSKGPGKFRLSQSSGRDNIKAVRTIMRKKTYLQEQEQPVSRHPPSPPRPDGNVKQIQCVGGLQKCTTPTFSSSNWDQNVKLGVT